MSQQLLAAFVAGTMVVVVGCGGGGDGTGQVLSGKGENCTKTADCEVGLKCIGFVCVKSSAETDAVGAQDVVLTPPDGIGECVGNEVLIEDKCVDIGIKWVPIPAGELQMGCVANDGGCQEDELPAHTVTLSAFEMLETEVTEHQYELVRGEDLSCDYGTGGGASSPVECVEWSEAKAFCTAVGGRLPTEAEWEYAARAGTSTIYICGDESECLDEHCWNEDNSGGHKHDVKGKGPNGFGLYDMSGNVWEWVSDWYDFDFYSVSEAENPTGPSSGTHKVLRGSAFHAKPEQFMRLSDRNADLPPAEIGGYLTGFRCVRSPRQDGH